MALPLIGGALIGGLSSLFGQSQANRAQEQQAQKQMDFQERMSDTSYQRAVQDMKLAGINPALAYAQGGASTPSGAMATPQDVIGPAVSSAMAGARMGKELDLLDAQVTTQKNLADKTFWDAQQSGFDSMFPDSVVEGDSPNRRIGDTYWGMAKQALINQMRSGAMSAQANARLTDTRQRLEAMTGVRGRQQLRWDQGRIGQFANKVGFARASLWGGSPEGLPFPTEIP